MDCFKAGGKRCRALLLLSIATLEAHQWGQQARKGFVGADGDGLLRKSSIEAIVSSLKTANDDGSSKLMQFPLIPHHVKFPNSTFPMDNRYRRFLQSNNSYTNGIEPVQMGALYQGYGTHYVDLWVGTPNPQRQTLIVDTGSGVTAFPCSSCASDCGEGHHVDKVYREEKSETFQKIPCDECQTKESRCFVGFTDQDKIKACRISNFYVEGSSWFAFEATDKVYFGGLHDHALTEGKNGATDDVDPLNAKTFSFDMMFGCQTGMTGSFKFQLSDGILGMNNAPTSFWRQMHKQKMIPHENFSLCFTRHSIPRREGTTAGALTMGGTDKRLHMTPMVFTHRTVPTVSNNNNNITNSSDSASFNVHVRHVYLRHYAGGESALSSNPRANIISLTNNIPEIELNRGNVIVDSGTTDTYLTSLLVDEFQRAFVELTGGRVYSYLPMKFLTRDDVLRFPTILIQLAGDEELNKRLYLNNPSKIAGLAGDLDPNHPYDVIVAIPPSHYMRYDLLNDGYVGRFHMDARRGAVLGSNLMMGHDVYFDGETQQIGFAESTCDYLELVQDMMMGITATTPPIIVHPIKEPDTYRYYTPSASTTNEDSEFNTMMAAVATSILVVILVVIAFARQNRDYPPAVPPRYAPAASAGNNGRNNNAQHQRCPQQ